MLAEFDPIPALATLTRHEVRFVVIGGIAAIAQGYPLPTEDVDVAAARDVDNRARLVGAFAELDAKLRVARADPVPFPLDARFLGEAVSWTLATRYGPLDILFEPAGTSGYDDLKRDAVEIALGDFVVLVASLRDLIRMKEASGREKDVAQLPALRATLARTRQRELEE